MHGLQTDSTMQINLNSKNPFDRARQAFKKETPPAKSYAEHKANFEKSAPGAEVQKAFTPLPYPTRRKITFAVLARTGGGIN